MLLALTFNAEMPEFPRAGVSMSVDSVAELKEAIEQCGLQSLERVECLEHEEAW